MEIKNRVELRLEKHEKCALVCDVDAPLGYLYDYSCALQGFLLERMKQAEDAQKASQAKPVDVQPEVQV